MLLAMITNELFKCYKDLKTLFFAHLLALLVRWLCFYLVISLVDLTINLICLTVALTIGRVELMAKRLLLAFQSIFCRTN